MIKYAIFFLTNWCWKISFLFQIKPLGKFWNRIELHYSQLLYLIVIIACGQVNKSGQYELICKDLSKWWNLLFSFTSTCVNKISSLFRIKPLSKFEARSSRIFLNFSRGKWFSWRAKVLLASAYVLMSEVKSTTMMHFQRRL